MQRETKFKIKVRAELEKRCENIYITKIQQVAIRGIPDFLICYQGKFYAWELKCPPNKIHPSGLQQYNIDAINKAGGKAKVVTPDNLEESIKELLNGGFTHR